jgi:hypothetical protein
MADEVKNLFGGFDAIVDQLIPSGKSINNDDDIPEVDPEEIKKAMKSPDDDQDNDFKQVPADKKIEEPTIDPKKVEDPEESNDKKEDDEEETDEIDIEEKEIVETFSDLFAEELGWEYENDTKPSNIKDLVKHMQDIINENSQPKYANEEVKELDDFVKTGGKVSDFYKTVYRSEVNVDDIDLTKDFNQKSIIKENLRNRGYSEQRIEKFISKYEETDSLEDEAKDSLEEVKEFREKSKKELLEAQKNRQESELQEQLFFIQNVEKSIKDIDNIRGIPISDKEKKETLEYILKPERDGLTKYQKEYSSDLKNLFESAYFTKNRNTLVKEIQKKATSDAVKNLKLKLKSQGKSTKNTHPDMDEGGKVTQLWEIASKELKSFN